MFVVEVVSVLATLIVLRDLAAGRSDIGLLAQITCSFSTSVHRQALLAGTQGIIQTSLDRRSTSPVTTLMQRVRADVEAALSPDNSRGHIGSLDPFLMLER